MTDSWHAQTQALHARNMTFLEKALPVLARRLKALKPEGRLVLENGDFCVDQGKMRHFPGGARKEAQAIVSRFAQKPTRILFGDTDMALATEVMPEPEENGSPWLTRKYDDLREDHHCSDFVTALIREVKEKGVNVDSKPVQYHPFYLAIFGVGLGFHIGPLLNRYQPEVLVILESDIEMMYHSTFTFDWEGLTTMMKSLGRRVNLVVEDDGFTMYNKLKGVVHREAVLGLDGFMLFRHSMTPVLHTAYTQFNNPQVANIATFVGFLVDEYNMLKNSFRNLKTGGKRVLRPMRTKLGLPVIIVASGPSLDENLDFLRENQDKAVIICSDSSLPVLVRNGIRPDFQAVLERAKSVRDRHDEAAEELDLSEINLIATSTIWPGIDEYFKRTVYFFRPALSPLAIFAKDMEEVLSNEGPQVVNMAFTFAHHLQFDEFYLVGVDLGTADPDRARSDQAWAAKGAKTRKFNLPVRGNFGRTVFTNQMLGQVRTVIETTIRANKNKNAAYYNLSNGVRITGAVAKRSGEVQLAMPTVDKAALIEQLFDTFPEYSRERFISSWLGADVRAATATMIQELREVLTKADAWDNKLLKRLDEICVYVGKPLRKQLAPRLLRGSLLRMFMFANALFLRLEKKDQAPQLLEIVRAELLDMLKKMEFEVYSLADELEAEDEYFAATL